MVWDPPGFNTWTFLFSLYINDCNLFSDERIYADNTNLTYASKDADELFSFLTRDLVNLKQCLELILIA